MLGEREKFLEKARKIVLSRFPEAELEIPEKGKRNLVYIVRAERPAVVKLYRNPFRFFAERRIRVLIRETKVKIAPEVFETGFSFPFFFVIEEFAEKRLPSEKELLSLLKRLSLFHARTSRKISSSQLAKLVDSLVEETERRLSFCVENGLEEHFVRRIKKLMKKNPPEFPFIAVCHMDIARSNAGFAGGDLILIDWERSKPFFPQLDFLQFVHAFSLSEQKALENYPFSEEKTFRKSLPFFKAFFWVKRMKRAAKRGDEAAFLRYREKLSELVQNYPF